MEFYIFNDIIVPSYFNFSSSVIVMLELSLDHVLCVPFFFGRYYPFFLVGMCVPLYDSIDHWTYTLCYNILVFFIKPKGEKVLNFKDISESFGK